MKPRPSLIHLASMLALNPGIHLEAAEANAGKGDPDKVADDLIANNAAIVAPVAENHFAHYTCPKCRSGVPFFVRDAGLVARRLPCACGARTVLTNVSKAPREWLEAYAAGLTPDEPRREYYRPDPTEVALWKWDAARSEAVVKAGGPLVVRSIGVVTCTSCGKPHKPARGREAAPCEPCAQGPAPKAGRNEPCPCGSGQKFKRCCG